ncbi:hypothetical protein GCM10022419_072680 [Nonomuraea rosea]|uniref:Uncharacterized protein n=1 Tax=Nonomuraea rosea TaxID=638574 RepID=A0ABP6YD80_9ACTN
MGTVTWDGGVIPASRLPSSAVTLPTSSGLGERGPGPRGTAAPARPDARNPGRRPDARDSDGRPDARDSDGRPDARDSSGRSKPRDAGRLARPDVRDARACGTAALAQPATRSTRAAPEAAAAAPAAERAGRAGRAGGWSGGVSPAASRHAKETAVARRAIQSPMTI